MIKIRFLYILILLIIGCQMHRKGVYNKTKESKMKKNFVLSQALRQQLNISNDMVLPMDSLGMDSLMQKYQRLNNLASPNEDGEEDEEEIELRIDEKYLDILIPFAFNDLVKKGFVPISASQYVSKLSVLGLDSLRRKSLPYIYEYKHYFTSPSNIHGWQDDIAKGGIDRKEEEYVRYASINNVFVKGYNFLLPAPSLETFIKGEDKKMFFRLDDDVIHLNKFLFNNNKASLTWLLHNSPMALKDLLISYGYDTNEVINRLVLDDVLRSYANVTDVSGLMNIFVRKIYAKKPYVEIREGLFKTILRQPADERNLQWLTILDSYIDCLTSDKTENYPYWISNFTKIERFKIVVYLGYYLHKEYLKYNQNAPTFYGHVLYYNDEFRKYLDSHHYFNLPGFVEMSDSIYQEYDFNVKIHQIRK